MVSRLFDAPLEGVGEAWTPTRRSSAGGRLGALRGLALRAALGTEAVWNVDHAATLMGMSNEGFVRASCAAPRDLIVVGIPETDPLPQGTDVSYIGAVLWQRSGAALPDWVEAFGSECPTGSGNPPPSDLEVPDG